MKLFRSLSVALIVFCSVTQSSAQDAPALQPPLPVPLPLLKSGQPVEWWFAFKFNSATFPGCGGPPRECSFGGTVQPYSSFGQQFAYASSADGTLRQGGGCVGETTSDPLGATFDQVYNGTFFYVLWNDQFYGDPIETQFAPAGHSKGMLTWNADGEGMVLQVSTPSWPASGSSRVPRLTDGNTLGCVRDNNVLVSQHFFALKLNKDDVVKVLQALTNASVVTDPNKVQIVNNGGPADIQALVLGLGQVSRSKNTSTAMLSTGVLLISKPSDLNVPPWQLVSAQLAGEPLRVASWWSDPEIPTTTAATPVACWDPLIGRPGAVEIATTGTWQGMALGFEGIATAGGNHAKIGISVDAEPRFRRGDFERNQPSFFVRRYVIFGDMNQQGSLSGPNCASSQNGRGGLFFVVQDGRLFDNVRDLLEGHAAAQ